MLHAKPLAHFTHSPSPFSMNVRFRLCPYPCPVPVCICRPAVLSCCVSRRAFHWIKPLHEEIKSYKWEMSMENVIILSKQCKYTQTTWCTTVLHASKAFTILLLAHTNSRIRKVLSLEKRMCVCVSVCACELQLNSQGLLFVCLFRLSCGTLLNMPIMTVLPTHTHTQHTLMHQCALWWPTIML